MIIENRQCVACHQTGPCELSRRVYEAAGTPMYHIFWQCLTCRRAANPAWVSRQHVRDVYGIDPDTLPDRVSSNSQARDDVTQGRLL